MENEIFLNRTFQEILELSDIQTVSEYIQLIYSNGTAHRNFYAYVVDQFVQYPNATWEDTEIDPCQAQSCPWTFSPII